MSHVIDVELSWIREQMPRTAAVAAALPDLRGMRLACSMHLEEKMGPAIEGLLSRGAELFLTTCNADTVRDDFVAWCRGRGVHVVARRGMSSDERAAAIRDAVDWGPSHLCEMGADLTAALVGRGRAGAHAVRAGLEATRSGTSRLATLAVPFPSFNWDAIPIKEGLHNRHMVGLVACHAFFERTRLTFHGKRVLVIGYGLVGQSVCHAARAYGAAVMVAEIDPARALEASFAGWAVRPLGEALPDADVIITATGARGVLGASHFAALRGGAFLINVGHETDEIDRAALYAHPHHSVRPFVERIDRPGGPIYLFAGGAMANLAAGHGDSLNAFDVTLAAMVAGIAFIADRGASYPPGVHVLPRDAWLPALSTATAS